MQQNQAKTHIFFTVVMLMLSVGLWLASCMPDEDVVEVTVRPTVDVGGTAVAIPTVISTPPPITTTPMINITILPNPVPPLPGMVVWDDERYWLIQANGERQEILEKWVFLRFLSDNNKFAYANDGDIWVVDKNSGDHRILTQNQANAIYNWDLWSEETGVVWFFDETGANRDSGEFGKIIGLDWQGNEFPVSEEFSYGTPSASPDGKTLAFDEQGQPVLYHLENGRQPIDLAEFGLPSDLKFVSPAWSPDQQRLAWVSYHSVGSRRHYSVVIFDLETKLAEVIELDHGPNEFIVNLNWHPNKNELTFVRGSGDGFDPNYQSWVVDVETGEKALLAPASHTQWSPDGNWLLYYKDYKQGEEEGWWIVTPDGLERYHLVDGYDPLWSPDGRFLMYCTDQGPWLTSSENNWMAAPVNFGHPARCDAMQWLSVDDHDLTAYVLPPIQPTLTPTITPIPPTPTPTSAAFAACQLDILSQAIYPSESLQGNILFASANETPLLKMGVLSSLPDVRGMVGSQLWAIAPHGKQANRLTEDDHGIGWHIPESPMAGVLFMSNTELELEGTSLQQIPLPVECDSKPENSSEYADACGDFEISPDGKWAAFTWGPDFYVARANFGLINLLTGEVQTSPALTRLIRYLPEDQRLMFQSDGGPGVVSWVNSTTGETRYLGTAGEMVWNGNETAFAVEADTFSGITGAVWGYNVETGNLFLPEPQPWAADHQPVWTPDGTHLLYQHHGITGTGTYTFTYGPSQIHLADAISGEKSILAADPQYHYQLCASREAESCHWAEDWIQIRRYPYQPDPFYFEENQDSGFQCTWYGQGCLATVEHLGLNWRTGEIVPWADVAQLTFQVTPAPTAVSPGPNLSATPLYANPEIGYALYVGNDGRSLYCVPESGTPQKWVQDADWFLYVP